MATIARFSPGDLIYLRGDPAEFWYRILSGACRKCAYGFDGSRQIVDFPRPGDLFGYDAQEVHAFSVEAIASNTTVARYPRRNAERVADSDPQVARRIRELAFGAVLRFQRRLLILGRATALEKVSSFLLEMADSFRANSDHAVTLPMSRYDIADYLAMAVETVSRVLTGLRDKGAIQFDGCRCLRIRDRCLLGGASKAPGIDRPAIKSVGSSEIEVQSIRTCGASRRRADRCVSVVGAETQKPSANGGRRVIL